LGGLLHVIVAPAAQRLARYPSQAIIDEQQRFIHCSIAAARSARHRAYRWWKTSDATVPSVSSWVHGFMGSWVHGFMGSWVHGRQVFEPPLASRDLPQRARRAAAAAAAAADHQRVSQLFHRFRIYQ
jgi:hypothetical protein